AEGAAALTAHRRLEVRLPAEPLRELLRLVARAAARGARLDLLQRHDVGLGGLDRRGNAVDGAAAAGGAAGANVVGHQPQPGHGGGLSKRCTTKAAARGRCRLTML